MNPAEPVTSTRWSAAPSDTSVSFSLVARGNLRTLGADLLHRELGAEREAVPAQVLGDPPLQVEAGLPHRPVQPDRRELGDRPAQPARLRRQLQPDLEAAAAVDADLADELGRVGLEAVGRVVGADPTEDPERAAGRA